MKTKKAFLNFITDIVPLGIVSVLGIFKLKIFLQSFGQETLGLYQLFSNVMIYIALVDGGLSSALLVSLYKPNMQDDTNKINELLTAGKRAFSVIGSVVFGIAAIISFLLPFFIKDLSFSNWYVALTFMIFSLSNVSNYFFVPYQVLLEAKEKKYLYNIPYQTGQILLSVLEIVMLLLGFSFCSVLIMHVVVRFLANIAVFVICKIQFPMYNYKSETKDYSFNKSIKYLMVHKVNGLVGSNIDILIISKLMGLAYVAIYSTYNYIINMLKNIFGKISGSIQAIIGNSITKSRENSINLFYELNAMLFYLATIICIPLFFSLNDFINIWYEGKISTSLLISSAFSIYLFVFLIKISVTTFINAVGLFKETQYCAITDTITNLFLSIILVYFFGISGVVFATAISAFLAEYILKNIVLHKNVFEKKITNSLVKSVKFIFIALIDLIIGIFIFENITISNIFIWFIVFSIYTILNSLFVLFVYKFLGEAKFLNRVKEIKIGGFNK